PKAASDVRSRALGRVTAPAWPSAYLPWKATARVAPGPALAVLRQEGRSDQEAPPSTCAEYRMNSPLRIHVRAKKVVERISWVTPTTAVPTSAPAAANRCLPAASITALASEKPCRSWLVAKQNAHAPVASRTSTTR